MFMLFSFMWSALFCVFKYFFAQKEKREADTALRVLTTENAALRRTWEQQKERT